MNNHETFISGKDASLESSIERMQQGLSKLGFDIEEASWLNPLPHVWSVHIRDRNCPQCFTNGKGASKKAALASALGEFFERLANNYFFQDFYLPDVSSGYGFTHYPRERWFHTVDGSLHSELIASDDLREFYDPDNTLVQHQLVDLNGDGSEPGVCAIPYVRQSDGESFWFPVNLIANMYVSNGMSAGNTRDEARVQALCEVFERFVKFKIIAEGITLPDIPESTLERYPDIQESIAKLKESGFGLLIKDASLGGQFPVVNVTLLNPVDGSCFASFGSHPQFEVALERTVTELLQGRDLDQLNGFSSPSFDHQHVASPENLETHFIDSSGDMAWRFFSDTPDVEYHDWDLHESSHDEFEHCCELIHNAGCDIYIADFEHLGVYSCRIIVPGMSEVYAPDDLIWDNSNSALGIRQQIINIQTESPMVWSQLLQHLEDEGYDDQQPVAALLGLLPDANTAWEQLRIGELKCHLALALNNLNKAWEWCGWVLEFSQNEEQLKTYKCLQHWIGFQLSTTYEPEQQRAVLTALFGEEQVAFAEAWVNGDINFPGLTPPGAKLEGFKAHSRLLRAYELLQKAKLTFEQTSTN